MANTAAQTSDLLQIDDSVLVIVDMQGKLLNAMPTSDAESMLANTGKLLFAAGLLNVPVLLTEQYPKGLGPTEEVISKQLPDNTQSFDKTAFSCCACDGFNQALSASGRRQVVLVGQETHVCIFQSAVDLKQQGFAVHVVEDAVCSRLDSHKHNALRRLGRLGITVSNHESVLFEWLRDAKHKDFKAISALLR